LILEPQIHLALDRLSNDEFDDISVDPVWIDEAGEHFKDALLHQLTDRGKNDFRFRMSNVGRPLCQLQMAAKGAKPSRKPYNFKMQMMIGDAVDALTITLLKIAGVNITSMNDEVQLSVAGAVINGTHDIEIENKVFDIKTCSKWAFDNEWSQGYEHLKTHDDFGYVGQLIGYAKAKCKEPGGWIVICKSTGRVKVVLCDVSQEEADGVEQKIAATVNAINSKTEFKRCFLSQRMTNGEGNPQEINGSVRLVSFAATWAIAGPKQNLNHIRSLMLKTLRGTGTFNAN
jgi:hypothetical protein